MSTYNLPIEGIVVLLGENLPALWLGGGLNQNGSPLNVVTIHLGDAERKQELDNFRAKMGIKEPT